ncbi:hypothetical protein BT93_H0556 [Corymbia citriodora subsp. variegata]|nr:hypothetical protein BT93_H0556 [Corymbia citriodora subsp. variegata]
MSAVEASPNLRDFLSLKDDDVGAAAVGRRRGDLAVLTTRAVLRAEKAWSPPLASPTGSPRARRTLLDIIRNDELNAAARDSINKDRKSWKSLTGKLRLRRAGAAWPSTVAVPASDVIGNRRSPSQTPRHDSTQEASRSESPRAGTSIPTDAQPTPTRRSSILFGSLVPISTEPTRSDEASPGNSPVQSLRQQISGHNSARLTPMRTDSALSLTRSESAPTVGDQNAIHTSPAQPFTEEPAREPTRRLSAALAEERQLSAREAAAAREAAEAEATSRPAESESSAAAQPARMSLMDLLEETDGQIGLAGMRYAEGDGGQEEVEVEVEVEEEGGSRGGGAAFIPCGHTFCRLCSRELWVSRGSCPLCNNFIVEILDIF